METKKHILAVTTCILVGLCSGNDSGANTAVVEDAIAPCFESTDLFEDDSSLIFLSTLDGSFIGVNQKNGKIIWKFQDEVAVKVVINDKNGLMPLFLPDPKDGSLYMLNHDTRSQLIKLQLNIQQLVSSSPRRTTDGIFYTGKKVDSWYSVDWRTGEKEDVANMENACPNVNGYNMFLGRTEYNLVIHDVQRKETRNVTFFDYTSKVMPNEKIHSLDLAYFSGSSSGKFAMVKTSGTESLLWEADFGSPIIGLYARDGDALVSLPFTTIDDNSMHLLQSTDERVKFYSTLYVGKHDHGLYALPAVATTVSTILLLDGPRMNSPELLAAPNKGKPHPELLTGHYNLQSEIPVLRIAGNNESTISGPGNASHYYFANVSDIIPKMLRGRMSHPSAQFLASCYEYVASNPEKLFFFLLAATVGAIFLYFKAEIKEMKQSSNKSSSKGAFGYYSGAATAISEELPDGSTRIGKIVFHPDSIIGKGCEGTFVFKGEFDNRRVAVKRLLPDCFTVADREVRLLRESDQHPNVIRYFCMEQDKQFRYIALELCAATLQEYTVLGALKDCISAVTALEQATAGLDHLHSLNIVHRDIKPHNVLLSFPSPTSNKVTAMISDFGLCKKLQSGRVSFSRRSGITGTEGWIAPEMISGMARTTASVDIFSLGCVFYYVLSGGKHPFGDSIRRQANISNGEYSLSELRDDPLDLWRHLISKMLHTDPLDRPPIDVVIKHPAFWDKSTILSFLQDVSDRIEKEENSSPVLISLETGNGAVLRKDWRDTIEPEIAQDLSKYRSYRADSVRDVLRALRNKKHHYRELSDQVQRILGPIPDGFVSYWTCRFPRLLLHTWLAMQIVREENAFHKYYSHSYDFPRISDSNLPAWMATPTRMVMKKRPLSGKSKTAPATNADFYLSAPFKFFGTRSPVPSNVNWREVGRDGKIENARTVVPPIRMEEEGDDGEDPEDVNLDDEIRLDDAAKCYSRGNKHRNRHRPKRKGNCNVPATIILKE